MLPGLADARPPRLALTPMTRTLMDKPIAGPMVWHGRELAGSTDWIRRLSAGAVDEIDAALRAVRARGLEWRDITRKDFPLPGVSAELAQVNRDLEWGRGLVLLRGLPVERYSDDELRAIWWGLGCHLGAAVHQNAHGELIGEVRDEIRLYGEVVQPAVPKGEGVTSRAKARSSGPAALAHRPLRRGRAALRALGPPGRHEPRGQRPRGEQRHPRAAAGSARAALLRLLPHPPGRGSGRGGLDLRDAHLRDARRQVHHPVLAHLRGGGAEDRHDPAHDPGPGRGARPAGHGLRRARATRWSSSRATSSS